MRGIISCYLLNNPGAPYYIKTDKFTEYLINADDLKFETIQFFYDKIAVSSKHQEIIKKYQPVPNETPSLESTTSIEHQPSTSVQSKDSEAETFSVPQPGAAESVVDESETSCKEQFEFPDKERIALLEKLKLEINARNYSHCTLTNYLGAVTRFMDRLTPESSTDWSPAFKEHLVWLRDDQKLAPNTINQYAASIAFFMEEVLEIEPGEDILIRMKTGKPLPRVHSLEKITEIINAPSNFKHRLILMITYGCGLRLGEVCVLQPGDIDVERKVITIRKAKGKRDRIVMLDDELAPYIKAG